jgi:SAM-dependent methyltransferase
MICPLCGFYKTKTLLVTRTWSIQCCPKCINAWTNPSPGDFSYAEQNFHAPFRFGSVRDLPPQWRKSVLIQADLLTKALHPGSDILEIGCGEGILLAELAGRGFRVSGIEPSNTASQYAREKGLNVLTGYFPCDKVSGPFDAVVMSQVLEHLSNPAEILREVARVVPGGIVLLVQTNWRGLMPRIYREKWYAWVPEQHYWHFTPKGLEVLIQPLRWAIERVEYSSLEHGNSVLSRIGAVIPGLGDEFRLLARVP